MPAMLGSRTGRFRLAWQLRRDTTTPPSERFGSFGAGSVIVPPARISDPGCIDIGAGVVVHERSWLSVVQTDTSRPPRLVVGDRVRIGRGVHIACIGEVTIESDVACSDDVFIADCYHDYRDPATPVLYQAMSRPRPVRICSGAFLGAGAIVLDGVTVGRGAYIGEGAVVIRDVPAGALVRGNPARIVGEHSA